MIIHCWREGLAEAFGVDLSEHALSSLVLTYGGDVKVLHDVLLALRTHLQETSQVTDTDTNIIPVHSWFLVSLQCYVVLHVSCAGCKLLFLFLCGPF